MLKLRLSLVLASLFLGPTLWAEEPPQVVFFDLGNTLVTKKRTWVPGGEAALRALRARGVRVGIISNTGKLSRLELMLRYLPRDFRFSDFEPELVVLSSEVGFEKPKPQIYALALERAGVSPKQALYLDEGLPETRGARLLGIRAVQLDLQQDAEGQVVDSDLVTRLDEAFPGLKDELRPRRVGED